MSREPHATPSVPAVGDLFPWPAAPHKAAAIIYAAHGHTARERVLYLGWQMVQDGRYPEVAAIARELDIKFDKVYQHVRALEREGLWGTVDGGGA